MYKIEAITSNFPPTEAGMPKSVKLKKKHCMKETTKVPIKGLNIVSRKVISGLSPITFETIENFLSI